MCLKLRTLGSSVFGIKMNVFGCRMERNRNKGRKFESYRIVVA